MLCFACLLLHHSEATSCEGIVCIVLCAIWILLENCRFRRTAYVHQVVFHSTQNCYWNIWDVKTCLWRGNGDENANISLVFQGQKYNDINCWKYSCPFLLMKDWYKICHIYCLKSSVTQCHCVWGLSGKIMERLQNCLCGFFIISELEGRNSDDIFTIKEQFQASLAKLKNQDLYSTCYIPNLKLLWRIQHEVEGKCSYCREKNSVLITPNNTLFHAVQVQRAHKWLCKEGRFCDCTIFVCIFQMASWY